MKTIVAIFISVFITLLGYSFYVLFPGNQRYSITPQLKNPAVSSLPSLTPTPTVPPIPHAKNLSGGTQVFQTFNNCGPAALSMALSHYGISVTQQELGQKLRPYQNPGGDNDDKSVVLDELVLIAPTYGLTGYHRPAGNMDMAKQFIAYDIPVVTRTLLHENEDIGHYRVITGYDDEKQIIIQDDSLQGKQLTYSYEDFNNLWKAFGYEFVVFVPQEKQEVAKEILGDYFDETYAWEQAVSVATDQLTKDPTNIHAQFNRSVAYYHIGQYEKSIKDFEAVENKLPFRTLWYQIEPILSYYKVENYDRVFSITDQVLARENRAFSELYYLRGKIYEKQGNTPLAEEEFQKVELYNSNFNPDVLDI